MPLFLSHLLLFPAHYNAGFIPFSVRVVTVITVILISFILDLFYRNSTNLSRSSTFIIIVCDIIRKPFLMLLCCFALYSTVDLTQLYFPQTFELKTRITIASYLSLIEILTVAWILIRAVTFTKHYWLRTKFDN